MKTYLLSYPRSGSNWLCYIIETLTDSSVIGNTEEYKIAIEEIRNRKEKLIEKVHGQHKHWWNEIDIENDNLIFVIRDFKECIVRHNDTTDFNILKNDLSNTDEKRSDYISILNLYDSWKGQKHLVYYEDLINDPKSTIKKLLKFLKTINIKESGNLSNFLEDLQTHKKQSLKLYEKVIAKSYTKGENLKYHSSTLDIVTINELDNHIRKFPNLIKYLERYL